MTFDIPKADWLPLSHGLLHFHFAESWRDATAEQLLSSILFRLTEEYPAVHAELDEGTITVSRRREDNGHPWLETIGTYTIEGGFTYDPWLREVPPDEFREAAEAVMTKFIERTERAFRRQHAAGRCLLFARVGSPLQPAFTAIPSDVFAHFAVTDWQKGVAATEAGEKLFSIHAAPADPLVETVSAKDEKSGLVQPDARARKYPFEEFAEWALAENVTRKTGSIEFIRRKYAKAPNGRELDDKTIRKAFDLIDTMQGN